MTVSALIPTYNRQKQVLRAIDSVLAQTMPVDEIIVVDDGSTDGTVDEIRRHYGSRVTLFRQENAGASAARNRGLREAQGEWIAFLDSDDVWFPTKIERQIEALAAIGNSIGVCFTDDVFDGNKEMRLSAFEMAGLGDAPGFGLLDNPATYILAGREPFYTPSLLIRRSLLIDLGGFDEALAVREDTDLLFRLSFITRFCFVGEPLVQIDRTPHREVGLWNLQTVTRDDRIFDSLERLYSKWLAIPEVAGSEYEPAIRDLLRLTGYDSAEATLHQFRLGSALRKIIKLRDIEGGYVSIVRTLLQRKIQKLRRKK